MIFWVNPNKIVNTISSEFTTHSYPKKQKMTAISPGDLLTAKEFEAIVATKFPNQIWTIWNYDEYNTWVAYTGPNEWRSFNNDDSWEPNCWAIIYNEGWFMNSDLVRTCKTGSIDECVEELRSITESTQNFLSNLS